MEGGDWADYFYSSFSRAEDGAMRSLKLGVEERTAIKILTEDCLQHSSLLISEASLQEHGLSDLGPEGKPIVTSLCFFYFIVFVDHCTYPFFSHLSRSPSRHWKHFQEAGSRCVQGGGNRGPSRETAAKGGEVPFYREGSDLLDSTTSGRGKRSQPLRCGVGPSQEGYDNGGFPGRRRMVLERDYPKGPGRGYDNRAVAMISPIL